MLSSAYSNADDVSSKMSWNKKMLNTYVKVHQCLVSSLYELNYCLKWMKSFEDECEKSYSNYD